MGHSMNANNQTNNIFTTGIKKQSDHQLENPDFLNMGENNKNGMAIMPNIITSCQILMPIIYFPFRCCKDNAGYNKTKAWN